MCLHCNPLQGAGSREVQLYSPPSGRYRNNYSILAPLLPDTQLAKFSLEAERWRAILASLVVMELTVENYGTRIPYLASDLGVDEEVSPFLECKSPVWETKVGGLRTGWADSAPVRT